VSGTALLLIWLGSGSDVPGSLKDGSSLKGVTL